MDKKDYLKYGLYAAGFLLVIIIIWQVYRAIMKVRSDINTQADAVHDKNQDAILSNTYNVDSAVIAKCRRIANSLAYELETLKDSSSISWTHFTIDSRLVSIWKEVANDKEAQVVANLYKNVYTSNRSLYNDLKNNYTSVLTGINYFKVSEYPYITTINNQ